MTGTVLRAGGNLEQLSVPGKSLPNTWKFGGLGRLLVYALKSLMNIKMEWEWYVTPGLEGFGRGEREKSQKIGLN